MTDVGFEPTLFRTSALNWRLNHSANQSYYSLGEIGIHLPNLLNSQISIIYHFLFLPLPFSAFYFPKIKNCALPPRGGRSCP